MSTSSQGSKPSSGWQPPSLEEMQAMLPQYRFEKLLGRGGMGAVYKAVQTSLDRAVAIKVLPGDLNDDSDANFLERFKNEARTMAKMSHPSIVNVFEFGETQTGLLYFVMEFIDGTDVAQMILSQGRLPEEYALSITAHVCDALSYAHQRGVIHRDIKPANILINMEGQVKVADFGLAKQSDAGQSGLTKTNMAMGTPDFVAPEALIPGVPLDGRADLYAIGVMLYNMLTGEIPRGMWRMPAQKVGSDPRFDAIIAKAMQNDREARFQTASDIRRELDTILALPRAVLIAHQQAAAEAAAQATREQKQIEASAAANPAPPPAKPKSSSSLVWGIAATLVLGGGLYWLMSRGAENIPPPGGTVAEEEKATPAPVAAAAQVPVEPPAPPPPSPPDDKLEFGGHRYELVTTEATWEDAAKHAAQLGGHLATLNSHEEHDWMIKNVVPALPRNKIFLGGTRRDKSAPWEWVTGEPFRPEPWMGDFSNDKHGNSHVLSVDGKGLDDVILEFRPCAYLIEWTPDLQPPALTTPKPEPAAASPAMAPAMTNNSPAAPAPPPPATATLAPASPPDGVIARLENGFKARHESDAQIPFLSALEKLNQSYLANGIPKVRVAAQARGSLADVTALDAEKTRLEKKEGVPAEDAPDTPEALKSLRQTYRAALAKISADRDAKAAPLYDIYLRSLDEHITTLTKAGKLTEASAAQTWRDQIAAKKPAFALAAASPPTASNAKTTPAAPPKAAPAAGSTWRRAAGYLVTHGGSFMALKSGISTTVTKESEIPTGKFDIIELTIDHLNSAHPKPSEADFQVFNGLRDLRRVMIRIPGSELKDSAYSWLAVNNDLESLNLESAGQIGDGILAQLAGARKLLNFQIQYSPIFTGVGMDKMPFAATLTSADFLASGLTDEGLRALSTMKKLTFIRISNCHVTDAGFAGFSGHRSLVTLDAYSTGLGDASAAVLATMPQLTTLHLGGWRLTDEGLAKLRVLKNLTSLTVSGTAVTAEAAQAFQKDLPSCRVMR